VDSLKAVLAETVSRRRAAIQRLEADLDRLRLRLVKVMPTGETPAASSSIDDARRIGLTDALCDAVGVPAVGEAMENVYGVRSIEWIGWPYTRWIGRLRPDPLNSLRLSDLRDEIRGLAGDSVSAQPAEVDNAINALSDGLTSGMHEAWQNGIRDAARSRSAQLPQVLSKELSEIAPRLDRVPVWWRLLLIWQYLLVLLFVAGIAWVGTAVLYGVVGIGKLPSGLAVFGETASLPWVALMMLSVLGLGLLTAVASRNFIVLGAGNERDRLEREMRRRVAGVAESMVIEPVGRELARYNEFYTAMRSMRG
jgi:hypothetical protein